MKDLEIELTLVNWKPRTPTGRLRSALFPPRAEVAPVRAGWALPDLRLWAKLSGAVAATACLAIVTFLQMELPGGPNVVSLNGGNGLLASNSLSGPWLEGFCPGYEPQQVNVWSRATLASTNRSPAH